MSRYIDADALFKTFKRRYWHYVRNYGENDEYANCIDDCMEIVLDQPTADVKPVVRGEWKPNDNNVGWHCSVCKESNIYAFSYNADSGYCELQDFYCPHCGTDMRGEKE